MQLGTELVILSTLTTIVISAIVGTYLLRLWFKQSNRLLTDLPLVFAITSISQACQTLVVALQTTGILEYSMTLFRLRSIVIGGSMIPVFGALLQIWAPRIQKYHNKMVLGVTTYWVLIALFGVSESIIMTLTIPLILIVGIVMMVTFIITWKTGRLKEIRSEVLIFGILFAMASQILRVPLLATSLFYIPDVLLAISLLIMPFAFRVRLSEKKTVKSDDIESPKEIEMAVEY